jgi:hypothetical protein
VAYWIYRSYRLYLSRLEAEKRNVEKEKRHVEEMAGLHVRTIEALALAIEAKDDTTHAYALEVAKGVAWCSRVLCIGIGPLCAILEMDHPTERLCRDRSPARGGAFPADRGWR